MSALTTPAYIYQWGSRDSPSPAVFVGVQATPARRASEGHFVGVQAAACALAGSKVRLHPLMPRIEVVDHFRLDGFAGFQSGFPGDSAAVVHRRMAVIVGPVFSPEGAQHDRSLLGRLRHFAADAER